MISLNDLQTIAGKDRVLENELMSRHTTLRIGGPAKFLVYADSEEILVSLLNQLTKENEAFFLLGNGSNLLVKDEGYNGVIIKLSEAFEVIRMLDKCTIKAGAGVLLSKVSQYALSNELSGLEFASGIPGTLGGGVYMNAGAYGGEMKQVIRDVSVLEKEGNRYVSRVYTCDEMELSYRHSIAKEKEMIILGCTIELAPGNAEDIRKQMDELNRQRREKQPLEYPSAGSTFKRPEGYFAGKLISDAGLKGYRVGDAAVSEKHAGFCVNMGSASASDFIKLMDDVSEKVNKEFGVILEPEVIIL